MKSALCLILVLVIFSMSACSKNRVNMDAYNRINIGMSSETITQILGKGTELSRSELAGHTTVIYQWTQSDGGNIVVTFQDGKVISKAQYGLRESLESKKIDVATTSIQSFEASLNHYAIDVGNYPSTKEGLLSLWTKPNDADGWDGPYIQKPIFLDPWKNPYIYRSPSDRPGYEYEISSMGPDGKETTEDDITSWIIEESLIELRDSTDE